MESFDPRLFGEGPNGNDSYQIFLDGTTKPSRGKFEYAFSRIGLSFLTGGAIGWAIGGYNGVKFVKNELSKSNLVNETVNYNWKVKRSHLLNYIVKTGANTGNTFAMIAFTYSAINTALSFATDDDNMNTLVAATGTGAIYRYISTPKPKLDSDGQLVKQILSRQARLKRGLVGAGIGLAAGLGLIYIMNDNKLLKTSHSQMFGKY